MVDHPGCYTSVGYEALWEGGNVTLVLEHRRVLAFLYRHDCSVVVEAEAASGWQMHVEKWVAALLQLVEVTALGVL
jgi:hypothetical protein